MSRFDEHLPEDLRDIAERLTQARPTLSPLELDELHGRVQRRAERASRGKFLGRVRKGSLAGVLAGTLMLTSGAGAVIAATSLGGGSHTYATTSLSHSSNASFCQYHGPFTFTRVILTRSGLLIIRAVWDCQRLSVSITFFPFHPIIRGQGGNVGGFTWAFTGDGSPKIGSTDSPTVDTTAPTGTTGMTVNTNGQSFTLPFSGN